MKKVNPPSRFIGLACKVAPAFYRVDHQISYSYMNCIWPLDPLIQELGCSFVSSGMVILLLTQQSAISANFLFKIYWKKSIPHLRLRLEGLTGLFSECIVRSCDLYWAPVPQSLCPSTGRGEQTGLALREHKGVYQTHRTLFIDPQLQCLLMLKFVYFFLISKCQVAKISQVPVNFGRNFQNPKWLVWKPNFLPNIF